jgi:hypothetical protein
MSVEREKEVDGSIKGKWRRECQWNMCWAHQSRFSLQVTQVSSHHYGNVTSQSIPLCINWICSLVAFVVE